MSQQLSTKERYAPGGPGRAIYFRIAELLKVRITHPGLIATKDAWQCCGPYYGYAIICTCFRILMSTLIQEGKAVELGKGRYKILGGNENTPIFEGPPALSKRSEGWDESAFKWANKVERREVKPWFSNVYKQWLTV